MYPRRTHFLGQLRLSDRWFFKAELALRDGALLRTDVDPTETKRVFLKDPSFHKTIIQFDFTLSGQTTDLRLVTGNQPGFGLCPPDRSQAR